MPVLLTSGTPFTDTHLPECAGTIMVTYHSNKASAGIMVGLLPAFLTNTCVSCCSQLTERSDRGGRNGYHRRKEAPPDSGDEGDEPSPPAKRNKGARAAENGGKDAAAGAGMANGKDD